MCEDFSTGLNDCLKYHTYPLPSSEDIFSKLNCGKVFSKIDLTEAYQQVKVDEECSNLLPINTHKRLFILNRFPFGLKVATSLFKQVMKAILAELEFATAYQDDIRLRSKNNEHHKKHITAVSQKTDEYGFKLVSEKCEFFMKQIKYWGQIIDNNGKRAKAIRIMPSPNNRRL